MRKVDILEHEFLGDGPYWSELWIGCIDGPALPEMSGRLVYRNAGNIVSAADLSCLAAMELAIREYSVDRIVVCGHYGCRCIESVAAGLAGQWLLPVERVAQRYKDSLAHLPGDHRSRRLVELHVMQQVLAAAGSSVVGDARRAGRKLSVDGVVYNPRKDAFVDVCSMGDALNERGSRISGESHSSVSTL